MRFKKLLLLLSILLLHKQVSSQSKSEMIEEAQHHFENKDYEKAYFLYDKLNAKSPKDLDFKFKLGICCLNFPEKKARAIEIFEDIKKNVKTYDAPFYLGKAYHLNYRFEEAIKEFEDFKLNNRNSTKVEKAQNEEATQLIKNCRAALILKEQPSLGKVENLGGNINSEAEEGVPVITADESFMVFTYKGKNSIGGKLNNRLEPDEAEGDYTEDIFVTFMQPDSSWGTPQSIASLNTKGNDAAISISPDGRYLFLFKSDEKNSGDIYMSVLTGTTFSTPEPLNQEINSDYWEGSCSMSADGQILYFSSERPGGYGGRDIWASIKINNDWGPAINLGPTINTDQDEDAPFIHPDGITLFFSSKGHNSIGGYDVFYSVFKEDKWTKVTNMGMPLNTTEDDRYYVINSRGDKGYFSSNRGNYGGKGKQDIYICKPGFAGDKPILALLKGTVYGDDKPVAATLEVTKNSEKKLIGPYFANEESGKYLMAVSPGSSYRIVVLAKGYEPLTEDIDVEHLDKYMEIKKDFYLYSGKPSTASTNTTSANTPSQTTASDPTKTTAVNINNQPDKPEKDNIANAPCSSSPLPDFNPIKGKSLNTPEVYKQLLDIAGDYCADGLVFKVQIGAYRMPQNFKYKHLSEFGKADVQNYPDGITRFTQQQFNTIKTAEKLRQKIIARGQTDAWIVAFVNGKRYTLEELIMLDFLGKSIN